MFESGEPSQMNQPALYRVQPPDVAKVDALLTQCFGRDPLYEKLIPDPAVRQRLLPELMRCDAEEMLSTCQVYADSPQINGVIIVSDRRDHYHPIRNFLTDAYAQLKTDAYLLKEDHSGKTLWNYFVGQEYLNSHWTAKLHQEKRLHVIYFAVAPDKQGHGIADRLMHAVLDQADQQGLWITLETHNEKNVPMYEHFGFALEEVVEHHFHLKQFCLVRKPRACL